MNPGSNFSPAMLWLNILGQNDSIFSFSVVHSKCSREIEMPLPRIRHKLFSILWLCGREWVVAIWNDFTVGFLASQTKWKFHVFPIEYYFFRLRRNLSSLSVNNRLICSFYYGNIKNVIKLAIIELKYSKNMVPNKELI